MTTRCVCTQTVVAVCVGALACTSCGFGGQTVTVSSAHDQPETVDNTPLRIYRLAKVKPTQMGNAKDWLLTSDTEGSAPLSILRVWAGTRAYGELELLDEVGLTHTTTVELGLKDESNHSSTITINQGPLTLTHDGLTGPLMLSNSQFDFENETGHDHRLKLKDKQANDKVTLDYIHIRRDASDHMICLHGALNKSGMCDHKPSGRRVQIKLCSQSSVDEGYCTQGAQN